jgi:O-antigen ligase
MRESKPWVVWAAVGLSCAAFGTFAGTGHLTLPEVVAGFVVLGVLQFFADARRLPLLEVEVPFLLVLLSIVQWRTRTLAASSESAVDPAVLLRTLLQGLALALTAISMARRRAADATFADRLPITLYLTFSGAALIAAPLAVRPSLVLYQVFQLALATLVVFVAVRTYPSARSRLIDTAFWFTVGAVGLTWLEAFAVPSKGFESVLTFESGVASPIPVRLHGILPETNSDTVGMYGAILCLWGAGLASTVRRGLKRRYVLLSLLGAATVVASQYRTGYAMIAAGLFILVAFGASRRIATAIIVSFCAVIVVPAVIILAGSNIEETGQGLAFRGQTAKLAQSGTGRTKLWEGEIKVWEESPIVGHGLISASRYEVIGPLGSEVNQAHSTWFEALGDTGLLGAVTLAAAFLTTGWMLFSKRLQVALALWAGLLVLSVTDGALSFLSFGSAMLLALMIWNGDMGPPRARFWRRT